VDLDEEDRIIAGADEIGAVTSVAKGYSVGKSLALGYVAAVHANDGADVSIETKDGARHSAKVHLNAVYDPDRARVLS
ncbi:MAG: glycine cleavage T C-terminal barrel domain-containing protein, partial [Pseudomonadota bacterium]